MVSRHDRSGIWEIECLRDIEVEKLVIKSRAKIVSETARYITVRASYDTVSQIGMYAQHSRIRRVKC